MAEERRGANTNPYEKNVNYSDIYISWSSKLHTMVYKIASYESLVQSRHLSLVLNEAFVCSMYSVENSQQPKVIIKARMVKVVLLWRRHPR